MKYKSKADFYHSYRNVQLLQLLIKLHCCIRLDLVVKKAARRSEDIYIYLWIPSHAFLSWEQCFYVWPAMLLLSLLHLYLFHLNANWNKNWILCTGGNTSEAWEPVLLLFYFNKMRKYHLYFSYTFSVCDQIPKI